MLRPATDDEVDLLLRWRNQDANRRVSIHQHLIQEEEHRRWWSGVRGDPRRRVLVLEIDGEPCGAVTFARLRDVGSRRHGSWGFFLDHDGLRERGATFVAWQRVVREALDHAFDLLDLHVLEAEVLEDNDVVRRSNRRLGFVEGEVEQRDVDGETRRVVPVTLARADHLQRRTARTA